ncbi:MAG: response regulator transcription factor [Planctomycetes bacterium]|nr:response regulator transcription factor [Planctomycetota bacterium]
MMNILVVDPNGDYGSLVKGVLMSKHFGVSVSMELSEAQDKINTGLFDIICVDTDAPKVTGFINEANGLVPEAPIITLSEKEDTMKKVFRNITKPISLADLIKAVRESTTRLDGIKCASAHKGLVLPVELAAGKEQIKCKVTELGFKGALVEPVDAAAEPLKQFARFFTQKLKNFTTSLLNKEQTILKVTAKLAYTEQSPDLNIRRAGLVFQSISADEKKILEGLLANAA